MSQPSSCFVLMDLRLPFPAQRHGAAGTQVRGSCHSEMWSWDASSSLRPKHSPSPTERHQAAGPGEAPSILSGGTNGSLLAQIMKQIKEHSRGPENQTVIGTTAHKPRWGDCLERKSARMQKGWTPRLASSLMAFLEHSTHSGRPQISQEMGHLSKWSIPRPQIRPQHI